MRRIYFTLLFFVFGTCSKSDEKVFPPEPYIEFRSVKYVKAETPNIDALELEFYVRDGDSDLGLLTTDAAAPFHWRTYYLKENGGKYEGSLSAAILPSIINYSFKRKINRDTLPTLNCKNWELYWGQNFIKPTDTVYYQPNKFYFNVFVDFYNSENGSWKKLNLDSFLVFPNCYIDTFNGRLPKLEPNDSPLNPFKIIKISPQEFIVTYRMRSLAYKFLFGGKKTKIKFSIVDRALHFSNEVETEEFVIP
ncbi:MAG: hypothetical protein JSU09_12850 [Bacteroidetes bacterium]|nr:hypothetical protein [Bacteroidota bacterium]